MAIFPITKSGRVQKNQKKRRKKNFLRDVFLCGSSISGDKWAEKVSGFVFLRNWRGKMCNKFKKKKKFFFSPLGSFFDHFGSFVCRKI